VFTRVAHGDGTVGHLCEILRARNYAEVETGAPPAVAGVDIGGTGDLELGGGGCDFVDGGDGVNAFGTWELSVVSNLMTEVQRLTGWEVE
jgi:hypothetical protein